MRVFFAVTLALVVAIAYCTTLAVAAQADATKPPVVIGLDAEFGHQTSTSAQAIERGIRIAIEEINQGGGVLNGRPLTLEITDNRSVPARGISNIRQLAANPNVVAVMTGKFSPVVLEALPTIHELHLPLLAAWSAADGITDNGYAPNYVFRLSLTDTWALNAMSKRALERGLPRVGIIVPNTGWGRSSLKAAENFAAHNPSLKIVGAVWYNWGDKSLLQQYTQLLGAGAQAILVVANETEGAILVREVGARPESERRPIISHWGVTGGEFYRLASPALNDLDFEVVQTFSFLRHENDATRRVVAAYARLFAVDDARLIDSPVGVAHAYDLTHILARAVDLAGSTDRVAIRDALEKVDVYDGLVKNYGQPFSPSQHEGLDESLVFLARYANDGALVPANENPSATAFVQGNSRQ